MGLGLKGDKLVYKISFVCSKGSQVSPKDIIYLAVMRTNH